MDTRPQHSPPSPRLECDVVTLASEVQAGGATGYALSCKDLPPPLFGSDESEIMLTVLLNGVEISNSPCSMPTRALWAGPERGIMSVETVMAPEIMRERRNSLMEMMATRETREVLKSRGIIVTKEKEEMIGGTDDDAGRMGESLWGGSSGVIAESFAGTVGGISSPNGGLSKENILRVVKTTTETRSVLERRPSPWASEEDLLRWLPPRRAMVEEMMGPLLTSLREETANGRGIGFSPWKHCLLAFSRRFFRLVDEDLSPRWSQEEERMFCDLHEMLQDVQLYLLILRDLHETPEIPLHH